MQPSSEQMNHHGTTRGRQEESVRDGASHAPPAREPQQRVFAALMGCGITSAALFMAGVVGAQDDEVCFDACRTASQVSACRFDADEERRLCVEESGCLGLQDDYAIACFSESPEAAACDSARGAYQKCVAPCREDFKEAAFLCRTLMRTCLIEDCGFEPPDSPYRGRLFRP